MTGLPVTGLPVTELPAPAATPLLGHLWRWTQDAVRLLVDGAHTGPVFRLRLWRPVIVGYQPEWNRALLGDLDTFRSRGSLSRLTPYLAAGVVHTDVPEHAAKRAQLNPPFHSRSIRPLTARLEAVAASHVERGQFDALAWAGRVVRRMLNAAFFGEHLPDDLLASFFAPLDRDNPGPLLPRPRLFRRIDAAITRALAEAPEGTLACALSGMEHAGEEIRVALAAGYDTTAHTLAWTLWRLAGAPQWRRGDLLPLVLDEILRLYPSGWLGSRVVRVDTSLSGVDLPAGTMVLYSPYLTHRDPSLWPDPGAFRPDRFATGRPAWGYIPFSAGRRTCLGAHLARRMLLAALEPFCDGGLGQVGGDPSVRAGITLRPAGPLWIERSAR